MVAWFFKWFSIIYVFCWMLTTNLVVRADDHLPPAYPQLNLNLTPRVLCSNSTNDDTDLCNLAFGLQIHSLYPWLTKSPVNPTCRVFGAGYVAYPFYMLEKLGPGMVVRCNFDDSFKSETRGASELVPVRFNFFNHDDQGHIAVIQYGGPGPLLNATNHH